jgi:hypothetical protein
MGCRWVAVAFLFAEILSKMMKKITAMYEYFLMERID